MAHPSDLHSQLLAAFAVEYRDHLGAVRRELGLLARGAPGNVKDAFRRAHSLKGAARAVDLPVVEGVAHALEAVFDRLLGERLVPDRRVITALAAGLDALEACAVAGLGGEPAPEPASALAGLEAVLAGPAPPAAPGPEMVPPVPKPEAPGPEPAHSSSPVPEPLPAVPSAPDPAPAGQADTTSAEFSRESSDESSPEPQAPVEYLRIAASDLDEVSGAMHRVSAEMQGSSLVEDLADVQRGLRALLRDLRPRSAAARTGTAMSGGHGLELREKDARGDASRELALEREVEALSRRLRLAAGSHRQTAQALDRAAGQLRERVERLSLVPVETLFGGVGRQLRDLARSEGRDVEMQIEGLDVQADRQVLQALGDPVMHLLRNAVSHAAEPSDVRVRAGKRPELAVTLSFAIRGATLVVVVRDDGPGPDLARIAAVAAERGLLPRSVAGDGPDEGPLDDQLLALVFEPGFSTAPTIDRLAGRGIGLSVVAEAAHALGGTAVLRATHPWGAEIVIEVPLSSRRQSLLLVEAGGASYGLPASAIRGLLRFPAADIKNLAGHPAVRTRIGTRDVTLPIVSLAMLVDHVDGRIPVDAGRVKAVLLSRGYRLCAVAVDTFQDARLLTVADVPEVGDPALVVGAVILGDRVAPVLAAEELMERWMGERTRIAAGAQGPTKNPDVSDKTGTPTILVVDDSVTTRTLEKSILEAQGYRVVLAVDGLDALTRLRSGSAVVDLVITDVEMPRMNGFGLLQALRADAGLADLPVILMTSRAAPDDVRRGLDLGAQAYVTKQTFDQGELLATIGRLL